MIDIGFTIDSLVNLNANPTWKCQGLRLCKIEGGESSSVSGFGCRQRVKEEEEEEEEEEEAFLSPSSDMGGEEEGQSHSLPMQASAGDRLAL